METTINGQQYRLAKMNTMKQFHVARKVAPLLIGMVSAAAALGPATTAPADGAPPAPGKDVDLAKMTKPLIDALSQMSDADAEYVLDVCLSVVSRKTTPTDWAPIWREGRLVFDDINLAEMSQLAVKVIQDSLGNIFGALPASLPKT